MLRRKVLQVSQLVRGVGIALTSNGVDVVGPVLHEVLDVKLLLLIHLFPVSILL